MLRILLVFLFGGLFYLGFSNREIVQKFLPQLEQPISNQDFSVPLREEPPLKQIIGQKTNNPNCGSFLVPVSEFNHISRPFNLNLKEPHEGIDLAAPYNSQIIAALDGEIIFMGWIEGYGKTVEIDHEDGYMTRYAHLKTFARDISVGKTVFLGQPIGFVGVSGHTTGPHLHFEIRKNGHAIDPITWLGLKECH